jgi:uncharacterized MnhB-related membrane protein
VRKGGKEMIALSEMGSIAVIHVVSTALHEECVRAGVCLCVGKAIPFVLGAPQIAIPVAVLGVGVMIVSYYVRNRETVNGLILRHA